ncbi:hypothetical protein EVAR_10652_1 [Eumeta japonica]|uniref:Uncharacterized protein n=1 Tax=Eumeta variegata TaxID=151549 RepID=A0A4C1U6X0_EUMVA|nr:hypothetical protein EVAR_10652_1 [Eumeta japonica]
MDTSKPRGQDDGQKIDGGKWGDRDPDSHPLDETLQRKLLVRVYMAWGTNKRGRRMVTDAERGRGEMYLGSEEFGGMEGESGASQSRSTNFSRHKGVVDRTPLKRTTS